VHSTFTDLAIKRLPEGTHWDTHTRGLGVRVGKQSRVFIVLVKSGRRQTLGRYGPGGLSLADARKECVRIKAEATLGRIKPTRTPFEDCRKEYLAECEERVKRGTFKAGTLKLYTYHLTAFYPFGRKAIADITPRQIITELNKLTPSMKEHAARIGRTFFKWAFDNHYLDASPMARIQPPAKGKSRERVLTADELKIVLRSAQKLGGAYGAIVELLIRTGQRRGEIGGLQWSWINFDERTLSLPGEITKNGLPHFIPLSDAAIKVIQGQPRLSDTFVFPAARERRKGQGSTSFGGWSKAKAAFDQALKDNGYVVAPFVLHDTRRTLSTMWAAPPMKIQQVVVDRYLNHISEGNPVSKIYNRYKYFEEMKEAVLKWEKHLANLA